MKRLRHFLSSMVGRLFVILLLGMSVAAIGFAARATQPEAAISGACIARLLPGTPARKTWFTKDNRVLRLS